MTSALNESAQPIGPGERHNALDVLRGFALLGILAVNFAYFSMPIVHDPQWLARHFPAWPDRFASWLVQFLADGKFILIFSFLFGYGLHVQMTRANSRAESPLPRYWRRLAGLFFLGILHALLFFMGDILVAYAVFGALLVPFRHLSPRALVGWALACWIWTILGHTALGFLLLQVPATPATETNAVIEIYRHGQFWEIVALRAQEVAWSYLASPFLFLPTMMSLFFLGLAAAKARLLTNLPNETDFWKRVLWWSFFPALVGNALYATLGTYNTSAAATVAALAGRGIFAPLGCVVYLSVFALLLRFAKWQNWFSPLAINGRFSLSNYIFQSVVCSFLMCSYGFGLYGFVSPLKGLVFCLLIFGGQTIVAYAWNLRFSIGPLEWLLRCWTYNCYQPLRRRFESETKGESEQKTTD